MTFGKYKNVPVEDIPHDYLVWVMENIHDLNPWLRQAIVNVLATRPAEPAGTQIATVDARGLVKSWYRHASRKYHPDHGGSHMAEIVVNDCYETLLKGIEQMEGTR